jgi:hypothetical protein
VQHHIQPPATSCSLQCSWHTFFQELVFHLQFPGFPLEPSAQRPEQFGIHAMTFVVTPDMAQLSGWPGSPTPASSGWWSVRSSR